MEQVLDGALDRKRTEPERRKKMKFHGGPTGL